MTGFQWWLLPALLVLSVALQAQATPLRGDTHAAPRCPVDERLDVLALVYNARSPERSFAMLASSRGSGRMVGVGSYVAGRQVLAVLPAALWLGPSDAPCWMPLSHDGSQRVRRSRSSRARKKAKARRKRKRKRR